MNPKPIFNLFSPKGKTQTVVHQGVTTLIISSVALSLVALTACMQVVPASEPVVAVAPPQAEASEQQSIEALPNIDPADRKFFSPGYGTQTVISREAEVLPTVVKDEVEPDMDIGLLEFFSTGYGAISGVSKEAEVPPAIEMDMDGDLGLMEFFIAPNEAGASRAIETHADQDIGLMEFRPRADQRSE